LKKQFLKYLQSQSSPVTKSNWFCQTFLLGCAIIASSLAISQHNNPPARTGLKAYPFRLKPGQDLKQEITQLAADKQIKAGWISTCVGSLTDFNLRFANKPEGSTGQGHFEIVSLTGTVSINGSHLHLAISDGEGATTGGHVLDGCKIYTTAEIVILSSDDYVFTREKDGTTPWNELQIKEQ
jgi:uncharacterized protein